MAPVGSSLSEEKCKGGKLQRAGTAVRASSPKQGLSRGASLRAMEERLNSKNGFPRARGWGTLPAWASFLYLLAIRSCGGACVAHSLVPATADRNRKAW